MALQESASHLLLDVVSCVCNDAHVGNGRQLDWLGISQRAQWVGVCLLCLGASRLRQLSCLTVQVICRLQATTWLASISIIINSISISNRLTKYRNGPQRSLNLLTVGSLRSAVVSCDIGRYTLPVFTDRVHGCPKRQCSRFTEHGPWTRRHASECTLTSGIHIIQ